MINTLVMILAGGRGERLSPLTRDRAKPSVPFGGNYRIIDFVLSNFINSGFFRIKVLTQYLSNSLLIHLARGYTFGSITEHYVDAIPAQQGVGSHGWYQGTADAIYRNLHIVKDERPTDVAVFGGDHIYKMDIRPMLNFHRTNKAECTVAALPFDSGLAAGNFGIIEVDEDWRIIGFEEKPENPREIPGMPGKSLVSMGNYLFKAGEMIEILEQDAAEDSSSHDFGKDVIPGMLGTRAVYAYNFLDNTVPGEREQDRGYWRDVGTVDSYYEANMDLRSVTPKLNLYNYAWPIRTVSLPHPPAKFVFDDDGRRGRAIDSVIANGCVISGSEVNNSVVFPNVFVHSFAEVNDSILMQGCNVGRGAVLNKVICDKYVTIEDGTKIGVDLVSDRERFTVTGSGLTIIPKGSIVPRSGPVLSDDALPPPGSITPRAHQPGEITITPEDVQ